MFQLTYLHHACFMLRTPELGVVFDFWQDPASLSGEVPAFIKDFPAELPLYVLVSHFHKDHFNPAIFGWEEVHPDVRYIISRDVERHARYMLDPTSHYAGHKKPDPARVMVLRRLESYADDHLDIKAFGSTDEGNSYALTLKQQGLRVFHAGDLNCWTWRDESTPAEVQTAESAFLAELRQIAGEFPEFDAVMFPVDSRIGTGYSEGARLFTERIRVKRFFPMHFTLADDEASLRQRVHDAVDFAQYAPERGEFIGLTQAYDTFADRDAGAQGEAPAAEIPVEYSESWFQSAGDSNAEQLLALPVLVSRLIDISTTHANDMGIGNPAMPDDHSGWVLSRLTVEMEEYPVVDTTYRIETWVESWNRHFSERDFCICDPEGRPYGYARSIWMVLDTTTRANAGLNRLPFRDEFLSPRQCPIKRQGKHLAMMLPSELTGKERRVLVADADPVIHTFGFSDLDAYRHVNTVRYVMLLLNQFSLEEHDNHVVHRIELSFLDEGSYGMTVEILRHDDVEDGFPATYFLLRDMTTHNPVLFARVYRREISSRPKQ